MLSTVYSNYKGYHVPKHYSKFSSPVPYLFSSGRHLVTNGFDVLNWNNDEGDNSFKFVSENYEKKANENVNVNGTTVVGEEELTKSKKKQNQVSSKQKRQERRIRRQKNKTVTNARTCNSSNRQQQTATMLYNYIIRNNNGSHHDRILDYHDTSLYKEDIFNLRDDQWLNDNNLSFVYELLEIKQLSKSERTNYGNYPGPIVLLRPSMVYLLAHSPGMYANIENFYKKNLERIIIKYKLTSKI